MACKSGKVETSDEARTYVVTGADSGLGRAIAHELGNAARVITCGIGESVDVRADLATPVGRADLIRQVRDRTDGRIDAVIAVAGMDDRGPNTVALNYFGTIAVLDGLRDCLAASPAGAAVVISSSSTLNRGSGALVRACLRGDEERAGRVARRLVSTRRGSQIYRSSKMALNLWVRSAAVAAEWAGNGIVLNAVAPGIIATEQVVSSWHRQQRLLQTALPQPLGSPGPVEPVAELVAHLASPRNRFITGQVIYGDGGTDALMRKGRPQRVYLRYHPRDVRAMVDASRELARS